MSDPQEHPPAGGPLQPLAVPSALRGLVAVRHGRSTANAAFAEAARTGRTDPLGGTDAGVGLAEPGLRQAAALGERLARPDGGPRPGLVVCSPYLRARRTWAVMASVLAERGAAVPVALVDERLRDREMGVFELYPPAAIRARAPREAERRARLGEWFYRPPGGESLADVALRVRDLLTQLDRTVPGRRVLLVTHDSVVVAVRHVLAGAGAPVPDGAAAVPNASLSAWESDGRHLRLVTWADTAHLLP